VTAGGHGPRKRPAGTACGAIPSRPHAPQGCGFRGVSSLENPAPWVRFQNQFKADRANWGAHTSRPHAADSSLLRTGGWCRRSCITKTLQGRMQFLDCALRTKRKDRLGVRATSRPHVTPGGDPSRRALFPAGRMQAINLYRFRRVPAKGSYWMEICAGRTALD